MSSGSPRYRIELSRTAASYYRRADSRAAERLDRCFKSLERDPFDFEHLDLKRLLGRLAGRMRCRVGRLRVIYRVDEEQKAVYVEAISPRGDLY